MQKVFLLFTFFWLFSGIVQAQYVNTDSLVIWPGISDPITINQVKVIKIQFKENNPTFFEQFLLPGSGGNVISRFGPRSGRMHYGTDIKMNLGDTILAVKDGTVNRASYYYGFGNLVVIQHEKNLETYYAPLSKFLVKKVEWVKKGNPIGLGGSTGRARGNHLHFEIRESGKPFDSEMVFDFEKRQIRNDAKKEETLAQLHKILKPKGYSTNVAVPEYYKVRLGDSLWVISRRYKMSINSICRLNNISENSVLQIGQPLKMY